MEGCRLGCRWICSGEVYALALRVYSARDEWRRVCQAGLSRWSGRAARRACSGSNPPDCGVTERLVTVAAVDGDMCGLASEPMLTIVDDQTNRAATVEAFVRLATTGFKNGRMLIVGER